MKHFKDVAQRSPIYANLSEYVRWFIPYYFTACEEVITGNNLRIQPLGNCSSKGRLSGPAPTIDCHQKRSSDVMTFCDDCTDEAFDIFVPR